MIISTKRAGFDLSSVSVISSREVKVSLLHCQVLGSKVSFSMTVAEASTLAKSLENAIQDWDEKDLTR